MNYDARPFLGFRAVAVLPLAGRKVVFIGLLPTSPYPIPLALIHFVVELS